MPGTFLLGEQKVRPGVYYRRERAGYTVAGATNGILACIFQSNWGPLNKEFDIDQSMLNNLEDYYGDGATILREGLLGGAKLIRAIRVGSDAATCSKIVLKSTGENPTDLIEISAKYPGTRNFTVTVRDSLIDSNTREVIIYDGDTIFTKVSFAKKKLDIPQEVPNLISAFQNNRHFTAKRLTNVAADALKPLADVTQSAMTAGTNPTATVEHYTKGTDILERFTWNAIVFDNDNADFKRVLTDYVKQSYETGKLGMAVIAGKSSEDLETRMDYAATINDEKVVYVLNGWIDNLDVTYEGWRAAARIGGMIAGKESNASVTHDVIRDARELIEPLSSGEVIRAEQKGCLVLTLNADDQVQIDSGINTLVTAGTDLDDGWKKIRRTKCRFELMDRINKTHDRLVGFINNDENGRATVVASAQKIINEMIGEGKLKFGSYIEEDPEHEPEGDAAYFRIHILDLDSAEKIYHTYVFRYGQSFSEN